MTLAATAVALRDCAVDALADNGRPPAGRVFVAEGSVAWDECCDGQLSVRLVTVQPTVTPPAVSNGPTNCDGSVSMMATWEVTLLRCAAPLPDSAGAGPLGPSPAEIDASGLDVLADLQALVNGLACCLAGMAAAPPYHDGWIRQGVLVGPEGGCHGAQVLLTLVDDPLCSCP